ncbi:MAG: hypothetical protein AAF721_19500 [Myxococcota bacterium]
MRATPKRQCRPRHGRAQTRWASRVGAWARSWPLAVIVAALGWLGAAGEAQANPDLRWRTMESEHFYVHYSVGEEDAAERTITTAERAYDRLAIAWGHDVYLKTHITLSDTTDTANGSATANPFPQIRANATAPGALSVLEAYDDWIDILITHELVHVFHLDTVHGLYRAVNALFGFGVLGKLTTPNVLQPRWVVEGVATVDESLLSSQGRRRSAQFDGYIRMAVLEGRFQAIDQVSSGARVFPHGTSVYLYGLHFMQYIAARYGRDKLRDLSHHYASQIVPYGINRAIENIVGEDFYTLWEEFKVDTRRRFLAQGRRIRSRGLRQGRRLTYSGESTRYPFWSADDGHVWFFKSDGHRDEGIMRIAATGGRIREGIGIGRQGADVDVQPMIEVEDSTEGSFVGASKDVVFSMGGVHDLRYRWNDLYRYNGGDPRRFERLTFGIRATEPHVSPDGRTAVFRRNDIAQSRLGFLDLNTGDVTEVAPKGRVAQVYTPRFSPDGTQVVYSGWVEGGYRDIYLYDREAGTSRRLTADRHMDLSPTWSPDGRYIVFTSDRDDVYNIYAFDTEDDSLHQVSNVLGGAYEPAVSHDGTRIAYVGYSSNGFDLWVMPMDREQWLDAMPAAADLPTVDDNKPPLVAGDRRPPTLSARRYQPGRTMFPRALFPAAADFSALEFDNLLGLDLAVIDILGFHAVTGSFRWLTAQQVAVGSAAYTFSRLWPNFRISLSRGFSNRRGFTRYLYDRPEQIGTYEVTGYRERSTRVGVGTSLPVVRHPRHSADVDVSYSWTRWENLDDGQTPADPTAPLTDLPEVGDAAQLNLGMSYTSTGDGRHRFTYGTERGRSVAVSTSLLEKRLGGDFDDIRMTASYTEVLPMPWRGHQSLVLGLRGGASAGGLARRGAFCVGDFLSTTDVVLSVLNRLGTGANGCALLRGYPVAGKAGRYFTVATAEYRIPLLDVDRGVGSAPFFFQRIGLIPFADYGYAWTNPIELKDLRWGAGGALVFSLTLGYLETVQLFFQYAHGFDPEEGLDNFRALVQTSF